MHLIALCKLCNLYSPSYLTEQMKVYGLNGACSTHGRHWKCIRNISCKIWYRWLGRYI